MRTLIVGASSATDVHGAVSRVVSELSRQTGCVGAEVWLFVGDTWVQTACRPSRGSLAARLRTAEFIVATTGPTRRAPAFAWLAAADPSLGPARRRAMREHGLTRLAKIPVNDGARPIAAVVLLFDREDPEILAGVERARAAVEPLGAIVRHKRVEEALSRHEGQLAEIVREQTSQLEHTHAQLRMTDRLASIGTLAAGLGHDMNNVLLPVRARLGALRAAADRGELPSQAFRHVEEIRKSVGYLQQLADGLHFLAMDPDAHEDDQGPTVLHDWWSRVGPLISRAVPRHVRVATEIPKDLPPVAVASHRLTQAVLNLVVNAGEAIPARSSRRRGVGRVRVWARPAPHAGCVLLGVSDNGRGMTSEVQRRAFEMFFTTKTRGLGTGLGLPLVRKVAAAAGGRVAIDSSPGRGTTVTMSLQARDARAWAGRTAAVTVPDARASAVIRQVLEAAGVAVAPEPPPGGADVWIIDADVVRLASARSWQNASPGSRLVLLGTPARKDLAGWRKLNPIIVAPREDLGVLRAALALALHRHQ